MSTTFFISKKVLDIHLLEVYLKHINNEGAIKVNPQPQNQLILKAVCCICGTVYRDGETVDGHVSHGYCPRCFEIEMEKIKGAIKWQP